MGFLDGLFSKKEKAAKSDRGRKPPTNVNRDRGGPSSANRTPSVTPTAQSTFHVGVAQSSSTNKAKKLVKVDKNANFALQSENGGIVVRRRYKQNPRGDVVDGSSQARGAVVSRRSADLPKDKAKSSTLSLNNLLRNQTKPAQNQSSKPKRPATVPSHVFLKRGHKEGPNQQDNLSRTSSITNLDSLESNFQTQQGKGAKPRKAPSKERIDKQGQDGKKAKNNNKLEPPPGQPLSYSSDSLQEVELHQLRKQLREMADEKSSLALQLGEQRGQLNVLQKEILKLKSFQEESNVEMEKLAEENNVLRNRLRDVAHSPLSDNEKQQLLFENRHHSSAPASIATNVPDENGGDVTACTTPDWDKHSSGNVSEVSVACLQDKIHQMQETHYSTNEELQATLQELTDLQRQLTELQQENERLNEEKTLMFDSLCRQTERLNDSRQEVDNLKQLLYRERSDETGTNQFETAVEREEKLVELLRSAQEEREQLLRKLEQVQAELHESRTGNVEKSETIAQLSERVRTLECTLDAKHAEHKQLDQELAQAKDQCSGKQIEIDRLSDLLENARTKINELEQDRTLSDKSELDELLDNARKEKDQLESEISYLKEHLARSKNENEKLKEQVFMLQEECKVTRNNAKTTQNDLEYKCEKLSSEKAGLSEQLQQFQEAVNELQVQAQCHLEDKRQLSAVLSETQRNMSEAERRNMTMENELQELRKLRAEENDEWEKFQNDLLTSVRVANDFKTEAQQQLQNFILENKTYRERVRLLEGQLDKLKGEKTTRSIQTDTILTPQIIAIARNLDPAITNRITLLEHPQSPDDSTTSMEKLFPILGKERSSKSRENLAVDGQKSSLKKSKSKDDLTMDADEPSKGPKALFKRTKSKDNVQEEADGKGSRGFMKWHKSKENLDLEPAKERKAFLKKSKSRENLPDIPSESRVSVDSSSDSNKSDAKPEFLAKFIKKRDKSRLKASHQKAMSVEEEMLLKSLDSWYDHIDQNIPDELLSEEDRAVKRLKTLYEDDMLKERPVAHKPKSSLAISKPLLNSVVLNPKLERIFRDPTLPSVDGEVRQSALEDVCFAPDSKERTPDEPLPKSRSLQDINVFEELRTESELAPVTHLSPPTPAVYSRMFSDIHPNDSVSNPRYSSQVLEDNELPQPHIDVNYENLDGIIAAIPKDLPDGKLSEEQKFALKLKLALDEAEKQTTLKRMQKKKSSIRGVEISAPTMESVEKNWKLKEVLMNPKIRRAEDLAARKRHSTDISTDLGSPQATPSLARATSKSYEQISFSFIPENTLIDMYHASKKASGSSSSSSFTSAEFNLDTGRIVEKYQVPLQLQTVDAKEDLLYNETLNKTKSKEDLKAQLSEEDVHHPKILEARANYKNELHNVLKRIEHDELRKSLRKQRSQDDLREAVDGMDVPYVPPPEGYEDAVEEEQSASLHVVNYSLPTVVDLIEERLEMKQEVVEGPKNPELHRVANLQLLRTQKVALLQEVEDLHYQRPTLSDIEPPIHALEETTHSLAVVDLDWQHPPVCLQSGLEWTIEEMDFQEILPSPIDDLREAPHRLAVVNPDTEEIPHFEDSLQGPQQEDASEKTTLQKVEQQLSTTVVDVAWQVPQKSTTRHDTVQEASLAEEESLSIEEVDWQGPTVQEVEEQGVEPTPAIDLLKETPHSSVMADLDWQMPPERDTEVEIRHFEDLSTLPEPLQEVIHLKPLVEEHTSPQMILIEDVHFESPTLQKIEEENVKSIYSFDVVNVHWQLPQVNFQQKPHAEEEEIRYCEDSPTIPHQALPGSQQEEASLAEEENLHQNPSIEEVDFQEFEDEGVKPTPPADLLPKTPLPQAGPRRHPQEQIRYFGDSSTLHRPLQNVTTLKPPIEERTSPQRPFIEDVNFERPTLHKTEEQNVKSIYSFDVVNVHWHFPQVNLQQKPHAEEEEIRYCEDSPTIPHQALQGSQQEDASLAEEENLHQNPSIEEVEFQEFEDEGVKPTPPTDAPLQDVTALKPPIEERTSPQRPFIEDVNFERPTLPKTEEQNVKLIYSFDVVNEQEEIKYFEDPPTVHAALQGDPASLAEEENLTMKEVQVPTFQKLQEQGQPPSSPVPVLRKRPQGFPTVDWQMPHEDLQQKLDAGKEEEMEDPHTLQHEGTLVEVDFQRPILLEGEEQARQLSPATTEALSLDHFHLQQTNPDAMEEQHQITVEELKENQYGVVSPPEMRTTYRSVIREYKSRFHPEEPIADTNYSGNDDFVEDFFKPAFSDIVQPEPEVNLRHSEAISRIDEEMKFIMGQYVNTRASLLVKASNQRAEEAQVEEIATEPLSLEDRQFIEEMKAKYASADTVSICSEDEKEEELLLRGNKARPLSELNEDDLQLIDLARRQSEALPPLPKTPKPQQVEVAFEADEPTWRHSKIPIRNQLPPTLQPKIPPETNQVTMRNRYSSQPDGPSARTSKRLSDLMFTETIFVPIPPPASPTPPSLALRYKQEGHFKENVFVARGKESPLLYSHASESPVNVKKPLPLPRENLTGARALNIGIDNMSTSEENFSRIGDKEATAASNVGEESSSEVLVEESKAHTDIVRKLEESAIELEASGEEGRVADSQKELESDVEDIPRDSSNVNLFQMDSPLSHDSYLELFKSNESKEFEKLVGKKPPTTKPKIVDFVPLDENTTSVFMQGSSSYDTLEREKTFHVLEQAAKISKQNVDSSLEVLARKSSSFSKSSSTSRTSFSQAKKLFEALAEANKEERPIGPKGNRGSAKSLENVQKRASKGALKGTTLDLHVDTKKT